MLVLGAMAEGVCHQQVHTFFDVETGPSDRLQGAWGSPVLDTSLLGSSDVCKPSFGGTECNGDGDEMVVYVPENSPVVTTPLKSEGRVGPPSSTSVQSFDLGNCVSSGEARMLRSAGQRACVGQQARAGLKANVPGSWASDSFLPSISAQLQLQPGAAFKSCLEGMPSLSSDSSTIEGRGTPHGPRKLLVGAPSAGDQISAGDFGDFRNIPRAYSMPAPASSTMVDRLLSAPTVPPLSQLPLLQKIGGFVLEAPMTPLMPLPLLTTDFDAAWKEVTNYPEEFECTDPLEAILKAHSRYLTPAHLRKGKGGRQRATDPRWDPQMDLKKARRILANRLSAARSKMRQKAVAHFREMQELQSQAEQLEAARGGAQADIRALRAACADAAKQENAIRCQLQALQEQSTIQTAMFERMYAERAALLGAAQ